MKNWEYTVESGEGRAEGQWMRWEGHAGDKEGSGEQREMDGLEG